MQDHFWLLLTDRDFLLVTKLIFTMVIFHQTLSEKQIIYSLINYLFIVCPINFISIFPNNKIAIYGRLRSILRNLISWPICLGWKNKWYIIRYLPNNLIDNHIFDDIREEVASRIFITDLICYYNFTRNRCIF